jgi:hypothetical protein
MDSGKTGRIGNPAVGRGGGKEWEHFLPWRGNRGKDSKSSASGNMESQNLIPGIRPANAGIHGVVAHRAMAVEINQPRGKIVSPTIHDDVSCRKGFFPGITGTGDTGNDAILDKQVTSNHTPARGQHKSCIPKEGSHSGNNSRGMLRDET